MSIPPNIYNKKVISDKSLKNLYKSQEIFMSIETPFWHPSEASSFLLDWDGVIAETKLDFSAVRERYYGGRKALLLEEADTLSPEDK